MSAGHIIVRFEICKIPLQLFHHYHQHFCKTRLKQLFNSLSEHNMLCMEKPVFIHLLNIFDLGCILSPFGDLLEMKMETHEILPPPSSLARPLTPTIQLLEDSQCLGFLSLI